MSYTIIRPKDRNEWLEHRKSGIGSSEVATILGLNPWETPYQLWRRKVGLDEPKTETFAMSSLGTFYPKYGRRQRLLDQSGT